MPPRTLHLTVLPQVWLERPKTRGDCEGMPRPCPWVSCRHHLAVNVHAQSGDLRVHPTLDEADPDLSALRQTCSLDVAEDGEATLEQIGAFMGIRLQVVHRAIASAVRRSNPG